MQEQNVNIYFYKRRKNINTYIAQNTNTLVKNINKKAIHKL